MSYLVTLEEAEAYMESPVAEIHYDVARSLASGMSPESIAEAYGFQTSEIVELTTDESFTKLRSWISAQYHEVSMDTDDALDTLENLAAKNLVDTIRMSRDPDLNLRVLSVTNKAVRKNRKPTQSVLNPAEAGARVVLKMSKRIVERINGNDTEQTVTEEKSLDIDMLQMPSAQDVGDALGIEIKGSSTAGGERMSEDTEEALDGLEYGVVDAG